MRWAALAFAIISLGLLVWIAGEQHYQSCLLENEAPAPSYVITPTETGLNGEPTALQLGGQKFGGAERADAKPAFSATPASCSRVPF